MPKTKRSSDDSMSKKSKRSLDDSMLKTKRSSDEGPSKKMRKVKSCTMTLGDTRDMELSHKSCKFIDHVKNTTTEISIQKFVKILPQIDEINKQVN